jgi:hypothetical protein
MESAADDCQYTRTSKFGSGCCLDRFHFAGAAQGETAQCHDGRLSPTCSSETRELAGWPWESSRAWLADTKGGL